MKAIAFDYDLVIGTGRGDVEGVEIPTHLADAPVSALRYDGDNILDARQASTFYIDDAGTKHIRQNQGATWQRLAVAYEADLVRDGSTWRPRIEAEALAARKEILKTSIDEEAEAIRLRYITAGSGQAMVYQQKNAEAEAFKADISPTPDASKYPFLAASVGIEGDTMEAVADMVLATRAQWYGMAAAIEGVRLGTKRDIEAAPSIAAAQAARDAVVWP